MKNITRTILLPGSKNNLYYMTIRLSLALTGSLGPHGFCFLSRLAMSWMSSPINTMMTNSSITTAHVITIPFIINHFLHRFTWAPTPT